MKKAIIVSEEQYMKMADSFENAVRELEILKQQFKELHTSNTAVKLSGHSGELESSVLKDLFSLCNEFGQREPGQEEDFPDSIGKVLGWFDNNIEFVPEEIGNYLLEGLNEYEEQGFVNGFRFAFNIWKVC